MTSPQHTIRLRIRLSFSLRPADSPVGTCMHVVRIWFSHLRHMSFCCSDLHPPTPLGQFPGFEERNGIIDPIQLVFGHSARHCQRMGSPRPSRKALGAAQDGKNDEENGRQAVHPTKLFSAISSRPLFLINPRKLNCEYSIQSPGYS